MPVESHPLEQIVNVHWAGGLWTWGAEIGMQINSKFLVFAYTVTGNSNLPMLSSVLTNYDGAGNYTPNNLSELEIITATDGIGVTTISIVQGGDDVGFASATWQLSATFQSKDDALAFRPFGGTIVQMQMMVMGSASEPVPNGFVTFSCGGTSGLRDPQGNIIMGIGGADTKTTTPVFFNPFSAETMVIMNGTFDISTGIATISANAA